MKNLSSSNLKVIANALYRSLKCKIHVVPHSHTCVIFNHVFSLDQTGYNISRMELRPLVTLFFALCVVYATSKPTEKKDRVHHDEPLSNKEHEDADNFDYDHEAFLGQEEAKTFDQLTPEESKERLG